MAFSSEKDLVLDIEAERLIYAVDGKDFTALDARYSIPGLADRLREEQKRADNRTVSLLHFCSQAALLLSAAASGEMDAAMEGAGRLAQTAETLSSMPENYGCVLIRYRGRGIPGQGRALVRNDYVVLLGPIVVDAAEIAAAARRLGQPALESEFNRAVAMLTGLTVNTFGAGLPRDDRSTLEEYTKTFGALAEAYGAVYGPTPPDGSGKRIPVALDENCEPDVNLTFLAHINRLSPPAIKAMVERVNDFLQRAEPESVLSRFVSAYDAVFAFGKLKSQLTRPGAEVNNQRWLVAETPQDMLSPYQAGIIRASVVGFGGDGRTVARIVSALYAPDYGRIDGYQLVERLKLFSDLLASLDKGKVGDAARLVTHLMDQVRENLDLVRETVFDNLTYGPDSLEAKAGPRETVKRKLDPRIMDLVVFFRRRMVAKARIKTIATSKVGLDQTDIAVMARDFSMPEQEVEKIIRLMAGCFDERGRFLRAAFDRNLSQLSRQEKIFEFLWHYLKENLNRTERVAFLNAMKLLVDRMQRPLVAIRVLLGDFGRDPLAVQYYDRNGLMLVNLLLRNYSKELNQNIESTPEEVLLVKEGLSARRTSFARRLIDEDRERFFRKVRYISGEVRMALDPVSEHAAMDAGYVLSLEREVMMLFALVGGVVGVASLRSALREYGNPSSEIWRLASRDDRHISTLLQTLQVVIRGVKRVGERSDFAFLSEVRARSNDFLALRKTPEQLEQVRRVMKWI
ncbi:MAG: hypothetical protein AB1921_02740 [Thermodesulfobacteriota bacterium]